MPDVEGQWDFYPNLRLKIIFFSKWLNCAVRFVKFATFSRSGGTHIPKLIFIICIIILFTQVDRWNIRNIPTRKKYFTR